MAVLRQVEDTPLDLGDPQENLDPESRTRSAIAGEEPELTEDDEEDGDVVDEGSTDELDSDDEEDEELALARELLSTDEAETETETKDEETNDEDKGVGPLTPQQFKNLEEVLNVLTGGRIGGDEVVETIQWIRQKRVIEHDEAFKKVLIEAGMPSDKYIDVYKDITAYWGKLSPTQQAAANNAQGLRLMYKLLNAEKNYSGEKKKKTKSTSVKASTVPGSTTPSPTTTKRNYRTQAEAMATLSPDEYKKLGESGALDKLPLF